MWDTLGRLTTVGAGCSELNSVCRFGEGCGEMEETGTVTHERSAGSVNWRHVWCVLWSQTSFGQEKEDLKLNSVRQVTNRRRRFLRMTLNELQFMRDFGRRKCSNPVWNIRTIRILSSLFYDRNEHTTAKLQVKDDHLFHRVTDSHNSSFLDPTAELGGLEQENKNSQGCRLTVNLACSAPRWLQPFISTGNHL